MLHPDHCVLVCVESQGQPCVVEMTKIIENLSKAAFALSMPILRTGYGVSAAEKYDLGSTLKDFTRIEFEPASARWEASNLAQTIAATNRAQILVCGFWLEEAVTLLALRTLQAGIDVYLCVDAIASIRSDQETTHYSRLKQHNAVLTTAGQAVREWCALCENKNISSLLSPIIERLTDYSS